MGVWTDKYSFVMGAARYPDLGLLALIEDQSARDKIEHTYFFAWDDGRWEGDDRPKSWDVVSMCVCTDPVEQAIALGTRGQIYCVGSGDIHDELIDRSGQTPRLMRGLGCIDGKAYAVGMGRTAFRRDGPHRWVRIDGDLQPETGSAETVGLEAIAGFSSSEIYAVGWNGEIWHYDGSHWSPIGSPTNVVLSTVCCAGDGYVYVGAHRGLLLRGRGQQWSSVEHEADIDDIWGIRWFQGKLYISTMYGLYTLEKNDELKHVDMGEDWPGTYFYLTSTEDILWSVGSKDVLSFNGSIWMRID